MKNKKLFIHRCSIIVLIVLLSNMPIVMHRSHSVSQTAEQAMQDMRKVISQYDSIFKKESQRLGWDWRMLAAMVWNESRFNVDAVSSQGARGLMQFMPRTAERFGLVGDEVLNPRKSIEAGVEYLQFLERRFNEIKDRDERIKFVLAGYNAGPGHVRDAMALAKKYGDDPYVWNGSVEKWLLALQERKFYADGVCKHGFFRGRHTVRYVKDVFEQYYHYVNGN